MRLNGKPVFKQVDSFFGGSLLLLLSSLTDDMQHAATIANLLIGVPFISRTSKMSQSEIQQLATILANQGINRVPSGNKGSDNRETKHDSTTKVLGLTLS